jgi:hypothetical protein
VQWIPALTAGTCSSSSSSPWLGGKGQGSKTLGRKAHVAVFSKIERNDIILMGNKMKQNNKLTTLF